MAKRRFVGVNDKGYRVGEDHHRAKLTNAQVDEIHELREQGLTYGQINKKTGIPKSTIASILQYNRRAQTPTRWRLVDLTKDKPAQAHRMDRPEDA